MSQQTPNKRVLFVRRSVPALLVLFGVFSLLLINLRSPHLAQAATSNTINFQARLETSSGAIAPDGNYNVEFKLYSASSGGTALWTEDYTYNSGSGSTDARVRVANGYLSVSLGSITPFPNTIDWTQQQWITMNIGGTVSSGTITWDGEMNPRLALTAVPYAFAAGQLQTTSGANTATLTIQAPTGGNQIFRIQDQGAPGTYNLLTQNQANAGYIQLQGTSPGTVQNGNFNISGRGLTGSLQVGTTQQFQVDGSGNVVTSGTYNTNTFTSASLLFGSSASSSISMAAAGAGTAGGNLSITAGASGSGSVNGGNLILQGGKSGGIGASGSVIIQANTNDTTTAFRVLTAAGNQALNIDTTSSTTTIGSSATNSTLINDNLTTNAPSGALYGTASWVSGQYVQLTPATNSSNGELNYSLPITNYDATFQFRTTGSADATWLYAYDTAVPTRYDTAANGYSVVYDEYYGDIWLYYNGTQLVQVAQSGMNDGNWHSAEVLISGTNVKVYLDSVLKINYTDSVRTLTGQDFGFGAQTGGLNATHQIRNVVVTSAGSPVNSALQVDGTANIKSMNNSTSAFQVQNASGAALLKVDTTNSVVSISGSGTTNMLSISSSSNPAAGTNALIVANDTNASASGNLLALQNNGTNKFTVDVSGNIATSGTYNTDTLSSTSLLFGSSAGSSIGLATAAASTAGGNLGISAGNSGTGAVNGGNLVLQGGASGGTGKTGSVIVKANGSDSTSAFQVQSSLGNTLLNADSANYKVSIGSTSTTNTLINDNYTTNPPTGTLRDSAVWQSGTDVQLNSGGGTGGEVEYTVPSTDYDVTYQFLGTTYDDFFLYANDTSSPAMGGGRGAYGGYHYVFSDFNGDIELYFNGTKLTSVAQTGINNGTWHSAEITKTGTNLKIYFDSALVINYTDVSRTLTGQVFGIGAWNGGGGSGYVRNMKVTTNGSPYNTQFNAYGTAKLQSMINSSTALQVQNASGNTVLGVDTTANQVLFGMASTLNGNLLLYNSTNANTVNLTSQATSASYTIALPTAIGTAGQCLAISSVVSTTANLGFTACGGGGSGVTTVGTFSATSIANGASISGNTITFGPADGTNPGMVSTGSQSFAGTKTFTGGATVAATSTTAFQIQNTGGASTLLTADTQNSKVTIKSGSTDATLAAAAIDTAGGVNDFPTGWGAPAGWTLTANSAVHTSGSTTALASTWTPSVGVTYLVTYQYNTCTSTNYISSITMGGVTLASNGAACSSGSVYNTITVTATSTAALSFTPTSGYTGKVFAVKVQAINQVGSVLTIQNSSSATTLQIRSSGSTSNIFIGLNSGANNTTSGTNNTAVGTSALQGNTSGNNNAAFSINALQSNTTGYYNTAVGSSALQSNTTGYYNTAVGGLSLYSNINGTYNAAIGTSALYSNTTGTENTSLGDTSLYSNTTGSLNTAVGEAALFNNTTGANNAALGTSALESNYTGSGNTGIGVQADVSVDGLQNATSIGAYAQVSQSNSIVLGCVAGTNNCTTSAKVGIGITSPSNTFSVSPLDYQTGTVTRTNASATLTGTGTTWTSAMVGDIIVFADGTTNTVASFTSATSITMGTTYTGTTDASPVNYRFHKPGFQVTSAGNAYVQNTSTTAFQVQNASGNTVFGVDTSANQVLFGKASTVNASLVLYNSTNANTVTLQSGATSGSYTITLPTAIGTAGQCLAVSSVAGSTANLGFSSCGGGGSGHAKKIVLTPEYAGAVLDGSSDTGCTATNGTMTSGFDTGLTGFGNTTQSYYKWQNGVTGNQCYDIVVQVPVPSDFSSWASTTPITINTNTTDTTNGLINLDARDTSGTAESGCSYVSVTPASTNTWTTLGSNCTLAGTYAAGGYMTLRVRVTAPNGGSVKVGNIVLNYNSSY